MAIVDDDRDEAYHSGLYSLQGETDPKEMMKDTVKGIRRSPSPRAISEATKQTPGLVKQGLGGIKSLKLPPESALKRPRASNSSLTIETPMSYLAGRLTGVDLQNEQCDSPNEFDSGVFPSMTESAYGSMQPPSISKEKPLESSADSPTTKDTEKMDIEEDSGVISMPMSSKADQSNVVSSKTREPSPGVTLLPQIRTRSESPSVPPVGESVEVMTDIPSLSSLSGSKRAIESEEGEVLRKAPRLSDVEDNSGECCCVYEC